MRRRDLLAAARRVAGALGPSDCVLVGGLAVGAHGYVRATRDVDFVSRLPLREAQRRLHDRGIATTFRRGDVLDGDIPCLYGTVAGVRVDVLPPLVPIDWDQAIELRLGRSAVLRVVDLDGLLQLKIRAGGPRDLMDVAALVLRHGAHRERAEELAAARGLADKLRVWLGDRRLHAEIEEAVRSERRERTAADRRPRRVRG